MKDTEKALLREALATGNPQTVNKTCRDILKKRLQWDDQPDRKLRFLLEDIVATISFPLAYSIRQAPSSLPAEGKAKGGIVFGWGIIAVLGVVLCFLGATWLSVIGVCLGVAAGLGIGKAMGGGKPAPAPDPQLVVSTTPDDLEKDVEDVYEALKKMYAYRQLEGRMVNILQWFQHFYSDESTPQEAKKRVIQLLGQFGYKFVDFTPELSPDFELNMGNVEQPVTTEPAIVNEEGSAVCKGMAVLPKMK